MNVLHVASECSPFFKTGGLADVLGSLPKALLKQGINVSVILPKYGHLSDEWQNQLTLKKSFTVSVTWRNQYCGLEQFVYQGVTYYFIDNEYYFKRERLYGYLDEAERFTFFNHAVLSSLPFLDESPDLIHCHDWQSGLIPAYMKTGSVENPVPTVFTIHNLRYQGAFPLDVFRELLHFAPEHFAGLEMDGAINFLKGALVHSDRVTTVSPTYAQEIQTSAFGEGLHGLLHQERGKTRGILNGIDLEDFDPKTDPHVTYPYKHNQMEKRKNRQVIQRLFELPERKDIPLIAMVSRLVEEKGVPLLTQIAGELVTTENVQLAILGTGDPSLEDQLHHLASLHPHQISFKCVFAEPLARKLYAGADLFIMPSRFEPCGLSQMISLRYETVPIVRETGGLYDTIQSYNEEIGKGNGFSFTHYNAHDFLYTIKRALRFYRTEKEWENLLLNIYNSEVGWDVSAKQYTALYEEILGKRKVEA